MFLANAEIHKAQTHSRRAQTLEVRYSRFSEIGSVDPMHCLVPVLLQMQGRTC
jgi:hypothetical protein